MGRFELLLVWKYFRSGKKLNAINVISWISVLAITVVVAALIVVFSVFNGFESLVKGLYSDFYADATIKPKTGKFFALSPAQLDALSKVGSVQSVGAVLEEKALLSNGHYQCIVSLKGLDSSARSVSKLPPHLVRGKFELGTADLPKLVVGIGVENAVGIDIERALTPLLLYLPNRKSKGKLASIEGLNSFEAVAAGSFLVQQEFDSKYAFTNIGFVRYMLDLGPNDCTGYEIRFKGGDAAPALANIRKLLGKDFLVEDRYQQNQSLYSAMALEKWIIYAITTLILVIAAFNIVGALTMLVMEKQKDISVLMAMGAKGSSVRKIFLLEGCLLAMLGGTIGMAVATVVCLAQRYGHFIKIGGGTFLIDYYPVQLSAMDYCIVFATVSCVAIAASWYPARKAIGSFESLRS